MPWVRPKRRPWPWEALCWAITKQLIESSRAAEIQRRIVRAWAPSYLPPDHEPPRRGRDPWPLRDVPSAAVIAGRAPAELASMDLSEGRSLALVRCAGEVAAGRADLFDPDPIGACGRSRRSAPGPSSVWGSVGAVSPIRSRRAISPTSSWSATSPASVAEPRSRRSRSTSPRMRPSEGSRERSRWRSGTRRRRAARRFAGRLIPSPPSPVAEAATAHW